MGSVSNPGGSDDRENDESDDNKPEVEETKKKRESESRLRRNFSSSKRRNMDKLPTVFTYQTSQKHSFKKDDNDKDKKKPNAPHYYTTEVKPEKHQPRFLVQQENKTHHPQPESKARHSQPESKARHSLPGSPIEDIISDEVQIGNSHIPNFNIGLWATYPRSVPANVPACLALLHNTDTIFVIQQIDFIELALQMDDEPNLYLVKNNNGQCLYYAYETSSLIGQFCTSGSRALQIHVMDFYNNEVIYISKTSGSNQFFCCYPVVEVYSPPLQPVGAIYKSPNPICARFEVVDVSEKKVFKIRGPACCCYGITTKYIDFTILTADNTEVGVIQREVPLFSIRAGVYALNFPSDLDVKMKAVLLGALFFIDYNY